ncbi:MAG TPA: hypothetical protein VK843_16845, partial [Planctomycetota bacterium]|nr:hypothetical protein [Planctomycetota bacterium]
MAKRGAAKDRDPLTRVLACFRDPEKQGFEDAWVGLEPTFQTRRCLSLYAKHEDHDERYYQHPYMKGKLRAVARRIEKKVRRSLKKDPPPDWCFFSSVKREARLDKWKQPGQQVSLRWADRELEDLELKLGMDPSTFEFGIKPVPLAWLYDERFVELLETLVFGSTRKEGMSVSMLEGGGQFHMSAKTVLAGSLLADVIASSLNHPELSTWILDWPNCDDRAFRATSERRASFERLLEAYWQGAFHPRVRGPLTVGAVLFDPVIAPAHSSRPSVMDPRRGPRGSAREVFQTNFAFGRAVKDLAQRVHP